MNCGKFYESINGTHAVSIEFVIKLVMKGGKYDY